MAKAISWVAVNKSGEVFLDSDPSPLPRGWERCLDLQSGVMYLKQMNTSSQSHNNEKGKNNIRGNPHKRQKLLFEDDDGEGDPGLQLTLSLSTSSLNSGNSCQIPHLRGAQCFPVKSALSQAVGVPSSMSQDKNRTLVYADDSASSKPSSQSKSHSLILNGLISLSQTTPTKELESVSSNGSSPSCNASSSSSSSCPSSKLKRFGVQSNGSSANPLGLEGLNQERNLIKAAGCPHCFMYVLPSRNNPKCPRCKSHMLVDLSLLNTH